MEFVLTESEKNGAKSLPAKLKKTDDQGMEKQPKMPSSVLIAPTCAEREEHCQGRGLLSCAHGFFVHLLSLSTTTHIPP